MRGPSRDPALTVSNGSIITETYVSVSGTVSECAHAAPSGIVSVCLKGRTIDD